MLLDIHCRKCAHRHCSKCKKFARNSEGAVANGNSKAKADGHGNGNGVLDGQADMTKRLIGAYLMDWEETGEFVGSGKP